MAFASLGDFDNLYRKPPTANDYPRIYLFGDSLTERAFLAGSKGFGWWLREYYADRVEVVNRGRLNCRWLDLSYTNGDGGKKSLI